MTKSLMISLSIPFMIIDSYSMKYPSIYAFSTLIYDSICFKLILDILSTASKQIEYYLSFRIRVSYF